jgi:NTP pyrophosphatase (non-canonical NTP hydrolase)
MNMNEYQERAAKTAVYPKDKALEYLALGLVSEAGEVAGKVKKYLRGDDVTFGELRNQLEAECGDVIWYLAQLNDLMGVPLGDVAQTNLQKLTDRKARGKLTGNGDKR